MTSFRIGRLAATFVAAGAAFLLPGCGSESLIEKEAATGIRVTHREMANASIDDMGHSIHYWTVPMTCTDCHGGHGTPIRFPALAQIPGAPAPSFDPTAHTCSNVSCHSVPRGTWTYWTMGGDGELYENAVEYGGPVTTPNYFEAVFKACRSCHASPPSPAAGAWHSPSHGGGGQRAECSLCHPGVTKVDGKLVISGTTHRNGTVDVTPAWKSTCFGCH
jgi:predicted CxxxxCH...CXXCH cytochrome family protein